MTKEDNTPNGKEPRINPANVMRGAIAVSLLGMAGFAIGTVGSGFYSKFDILTADKIREVTYGATNLLWVTQASALIVVLGQQAARLKDDPTLLMRMRDGHHFLPDVPDYLLVNNAILFLGEVLLTSMMYYATK